MFIRLHVQRPFAIILNVPTDKAMISTNGFDNGSWKQPLKSTHIKHINIVFRKMVTVVSRPLS